MLKTTLDNPKCYSLQQAIDLREDLANKDLKLVITNGCFDLLHAGHVNYLQSAAQCGDRLWVILNSSSSIRELKGSHRPIQSTEERAYMLASLACIDGIVVFNTPRLTQEILALKPDVYVKAGDYTLEKLDPDERTALEKVGARVDFLPFLPGYSTTGLIEKIVNIESTR